MRGIAIQSAGGFINISGLNNNEKVSFYGIDGKMLGSVTAINGTTSFAAQSGSIVVAKIGKESAEIAEILLKTNCTNFTNVYSTFCHVHICWAFSSL